MIDSKKSLSVKRRMRPETPGWGGEAAAFSGTIAIVRSWHHPRMTSTRPVTLLACVLVFAGCKRGAETPSTPTPTPAAVTATPAPIATTAAAPGRPLYYEREL